VDDKSYFRFAVGVVVAFILGVVLISARTLIYPFILAVFISFVIEPVVSLLMKFKIPKAAAVAFILLGVFVVVFLLGLLVYSSGRTLAVQLPHYEQRIMEIASFLQRALGGFPVSLRVASSIQKINLQGLASVLIGALGPFLDLVVKLVLLFVFLVFIVAGRGNMFAKIRATLKAEQAAEVTGVLERIGVQVRRYLVAKTLLSLLKGVAVWAVLVIFGVDFALVFGFLAFLLNYIPNIGSLLTAVLVTGFAFFEFGTVGLPVVLFIAVIWLDVLALNLVEPRVLERGRGLSPLVVLLSLLFWTWLWGVPGMFMAIPLTVILKIVFQNVPVLQPVANLMNP
jgi:AI-2 transport protein TqsA